MIALAANARRVDTLDVVQFLHLAAGGRAMRFDSGKLHAYDRGSFRPLGCIPSGEILAIRSEYAYALEGIPL